MDNLTEKIFAGLTRAESGDESESVCEPHSAPKPVDSDYVPNGTKNLWTTDGVHLVTYHLYHLKRSSTFNTSASRTTWLCCVVQQGHSSLGHQSQFRLPPRH